jgi:tRNA threonylcarbamoyladenosine biosynthesis protein TsaE
MKTYQSFSSKETENLGVALAKDVLRAKPGVKNSAVIFALHGDLGSGKTTFVKGFFRGLGIKSRVKSPTFIIMRRSAVRDKIFSDVFHIDAYRMRKSDDLSIIDFKTIAGDPKNIILIEWPENAKGIIPPDARQLEFHHGKKENERKIIIKK